MTMPAGMGTSSGRMPARRRTAIVAVAAIGLLASLLSVRVGLAAAPAAADPTLPLVVDPAAVTVVGDVVTVVEADLLEIPFGNQLTSDQEVGFFGLTVDPADFAPGSAIAAALTGLGVDTVALEADSLALDGVGAFSSYDGSTSCIGTIAPAASCGVTVELTDPLRPAGAALELYDPSGSLVGRTFVLWRTPAPAGDRLADAVDLGSGFAFAPGDSVPATPGSTDGRTAEQGEPAHAGSPASSSWWGSLQFADQGRLDLTVQALEAPYGQGSPASTPIRAALYRSTAGPLTMASLEKLAPTASATGPDGTVVLSSNVTPGATYYLAVDDFGTATEFVASGTFDYGGVGFDPDSTDPLEVRTLTVPADGSAAVVFAVYNQTSTSAIDPPFVFTLPLLGDFVWQSASDLAGGCSPTDGTTFPTAGPVSMELDPGAVCVVRAALAGGPLSPGDVVEEGLSIDGSNGLPQSVEYVLRASAPAVGPSNNAFAGAEDISGLVIPPYVAGPGGQPQNTVAVEGTTVGATREPFEYGTVVDDQGTPDPGDDTETAPPVGTVWFRYAPPAGGFAGRLGYRVSPGFTVTPLAMRPGDQRAPSARYDVVQFAPGNTWPPSSLSFVRVEPGHTVWFQVEARYDTFAGFREPDGPFTLELYQAANEQDTIVNAYDVSFGSPWSQPFNWGGDGDTFHLTSDQPGGPADGWFTATFDRPGFWSFTARSETAAAAVTTRPLGLRFFRSPSLDPVADSSSLGPPLLTAAGELRDRPFGPGGAPVPLWEASLRNVPVEPGRYYWTFDQGAGGPTFFSLSSTFDALPKATATVTDCAGAPVPASGGEGAGGGLLFGVPVAPTNAESVFSGFADGFSLSARLDAGVGDAPGDTASTTCSPSAAVEGELRVEADPGVTDPVPVPVRVLGEATATEILGAVVGATDVEADASLVATVTITDPDTNAPVLSYEHRLDRTTSATPGGGATSTGTTRIRVDGAPVPGLPDTDVTGAVTCVTGTCTVAPSTTELGPDVVSVTVPLRPGVRYRYRIALEATVVARSADQAGAAVTGVLLDGGNDDLRGRSEPGLRLAITAPAGTSLRCSSIGTFCPSTLPSDSRDTTPPDTTITAPEATSAADVVAALGADEGNVTFECRTGTDPFVGCSDPFVLPNAAEGTLTIEARAEDAANNVDPTPARATVLVDRTPPSVSILVPADGATFDPGSVPPLAEITCTDLGAGVDSSVVSVDGVPTDALAASPGPHTVSVDCTDLAGNVASVTHTYTVSGVVDTMPPETVIESVTVSGRDVSVVVSGTDDQPGPLTFECAVESQIGYVPGSEVWRSCVSPATFLGLLEGYYLVVVRARDAVGNVDPSPAVRAFTVDVSPPQLTVFSPVGGATYDVGEVPQLSWACTDLDLDLSQFSVTVNGVPLVGLDLPQTPGAYTVAVRCVDRAGLSTTVSVTYTVVAPDTTEPTITISGIAEGSTVTATAEPTVTISSDEPLVNVICTLDVVRDDGGPGSSNDVGCLPAPPTSGGDFTFATLPDGLVTLTVQGFDAAGNVGTATLSFSVQVDPVVSITAPVDGATYVVGSVPALAYTCTDNAGVVLEQLSVGAGDPWPGSPPSTAGTWTVNVDCLDGAGNGGTDSVTYTVRERPRLSVDILREPLGSPVPSTTPMRFTVRVLNEGTQTEGRRTVRTVLPAELIVTGATVDPLTGPGTGTRLCFFDPGVPLQEGAEVAGQAITCVLDDPLAPGAFDDLVVLPELRGAEGTEVTVSATVSADLCVDAQGGTVCGSAASIFTIGPPPDTTPPETQLTGDGTTIGFLGDSPASQPTFTFTATDNRPGLLTFECRITTAVPSVTIAGIPPRTYPPDPQPDWTPCTSPFTRTGLVEAPYRFEVRAVDSAGNVEPTPASLRFSVDATPPEIFFNAQDTSIVAMPFASGSRVTASQVPPQIVRTCRDTYLRSARWESSVGGLEYDLTLTFPADFVSGATNLPSSLGTHWFTATCTNVTGLTTSDTFRYTVVAELTPPVITISGIADGGVVTDATPAVTVSSTEPLFATICNLETPTPGGGTESNDVGCLADGVSTGTFDLPTLPDGAVTLTVFGQDASGNQAQTSVTFAVEVLPTASITAPADGASYTPSQVPTSVTYVCSDNGPIVSEEVQLLDGGQVVLLTGPPPSTVGTHTIRVVCVDGLGEEALATATYTVRNPTILEVRTVDMDGQPVVGACYAIDLFVFTRAELQRSCDSASGPDADGAADGVTRLVDARVGALLFLRNTVLPPLRYPIPDRSLVGILPEQTTELTIYTYRCTSTCLRVQPKLGDGTEPTFPLWPVGVPKDLLEPVPNVPPGATAPPPFPTAFVVPDLTPGVTTDIPVVADDFGRTPLEVGRIRVTPIPGLNTLDPLTILPAHTISVNLQRPDGSPLTDGGACLQLRGVSPVRVARSLCTEPGSPVLRWRALPGFYAVEVPPGTVLPAGLFAPVLPANVPDTQSERQVDLTFRTSQGGTVTVVPLNFQFAPIAQLPAVAPPACEIGLFLLVNGTQATSPTATACFGSGPNPAPAVMTVPPGTYVVSRTSSWNVPGLTTGSNLVTVGPGDSVSTDLTLFDPSPGGDVPTALDDVATARPGAGATVAVLANDADPTGQALSAAIVTPPAKGSASVTLDGRIAYLASPTASGTDTLRYAAVDPWGNRAEASLTITIDPWAVLEVDVTTAPLPPLSRNVRFDVVASVRNPSGRAAASPTLAVTLPAGVAYDGGAPVTCSGVTPGSSGTLVCSLGTLPPGGLATVRVPSRIVTRPAAEQVTFLAVVSSADCADVDSAQPGNQCGSTSTTVAVPRSPVSVSVTSDVASVAVGGGFRYLVDVTNSGPTRAEVTLPVDLPAEAGLIGIASLPPLSGCTFSPPLNAGPAGTPDVTSTCRFTVAPGTTARLAFDARALRVPPGGVLAATAAAESVDCSSSTPAGVSGSCGPAAAGGPTVTAATLVATYEQTFPAAGANVRVGDTVRFRGGVRNDGSIAARTPQVQIQLPPELGATTLVSQPLGSGCTFSPPLAAGAPTPGLRLTCSLPTLAPGATASFEIEARVVEVPIAPAAPVTVRVASIDCADSAPAAAGVQCDTVAIGPGVVRTTLAPTVTLTPPNPAVGDTVEVRFSVQNTGGVAARALQTRLVLPTELAALGLTEVTGLTACRFDPPLQPGLTGTPSVTTTCAHPDLAAGGTSVVQMRATVRSLPATSTFAVRGEVGSTDCRDLVAGDAVRTCATAYLPTPTTTLLGAFGGLTLSASAGTISSLQPISSSLLPVSPAGVAFPYGAMSFTVTDVPVGGSTEIFVGVTDQLAGYWKLSATGWTPYPSTRPVSGGLVITLVDGGPGDADGLANGVIVDPGAIGVPNQGPTVEDLSVTTPPETPITVDVLAAASDPDGGVLEVVSATNGSSGSVEVSPFEVTYTPYAGATGQDSFTVVVSDGQGGAATATVAVRIAAAEPEPPTTDPPTTTTVPPTTAPPASLPPATPPQGSAAPSVPPGGLPRTGTDPRGAAAAAAFLVALGVALWATARRRSPSQEDPA